VLNNSFAVDKNTQNGKEKIIKIFEGEFFKVCGDKNLGQKKMPQVKTCGIFII
jgi:hypothetical protein